jgi:hypothetical protein
MAEPPAQLNQNIDEPYIAKDVVVAPDIAQDIVFATGLTQSNIVEVKIVVNTENYFFKAKKYTVRVQQNHCF